LLLGAATTVSAAPAVPTALPVAGWDYVVTFTPDLARADVTLCFRRFLPKRLVPGRGANLAAFDFSSAPDGAPGGARLTRQGDARSLLPVGLLPGGCVRWSVDLARLRRVRHVGRDLLFPPALLLLEPALWRASMRVTLRFVLPAGFRAAVPWPRTKAGGAYLLDRSALHLEALVAVGRMSVDRLDVAGTRIDIALLDAPHRATRKGIHAWLDAAFRADADLFGGRFPTSHVTVLVQAVPAHRGPVLFGSAMRGGGAHVHLLLASGARDEDLPGEWVAVHELLHLGMPWTYDTEAWMQEGFVSYYQEVLRARAGLQSEREAWQNLLDGFARGRRSGGERILAEESRVMGEHHTYHRVYWGGAAIAFLIDVELRRRFPRRWNLDVFMRQWHASHGATRGGPARGLDLLRAADRRLGASVCEPIARAQLARKAFPDVALVQTALGIIVRDGRVTLDDTAPLASYRRAIMRQTVPGVR